MKELMIPKTLLDYCETRQRVFVSLERAHALFEQAEKKFKEVDRYGFSRDSLPINSLEQTKRSIDEKLWREAFDKTGFLQFMDEQAKTQFFKEVRETTPEFTESTIRATFLSLAQEAETMFARGLVNVFLRLSKHHRTNTNSPFKVNARAIIPYIVVSNWSRGRQLRYDASGQINDIDRVFKVLDGKKHDPRTLEFAINAALAHLEVFDDDYYQVKGYGNGNMHMLFKRNDLLERANKIIHDYYHGTALATGGRHTTRTESQD